MKYVPKKILSLIIIGFFLYGMLIQPDFVNDVVNSPLEDKNEKSLGDKTEIPEYSSLMALLNNVDLAEKTALWLHSKSTSVGGGISWSIGNQYNYDLENGTAGIGLFLLALYEQTHNLTYLTWAKQIGDWFNTAHASYPPGKWPVYQNEISAQNFTGVLKGSAGIGKFLAQLAGASGVQTYKDLAYEIANEYISIAKQSPAKTGIMIRDKDVIEKTGAYDTLPYDGTSANNVKYNLSVGTFASGTWTEIWDFSDEEQFSSAAPTKLYFDHNVSTTDQIQITNPARLTHDGESFVQSIKLPYYPFFIDNTEGIKIRMYTNSSSPYGSLTMSLYEADSSGYPKGARIGDISNRWNATFMTTNPLGAWITFNWTSKVAPILNGTSTYGYCFKVDFDDFGTWNTTQSFFVKVNTANNYTDGRLTLIKGGYFFSSSTKDVGFNITAQSNSKNLVTDILFNSTNFGLPNNFDAGDITNLTIKLFLRTDTASAYTNVHLFNYVTSRWDSFTEFGTAGSQIVFYLPQPIVRNYVSGFSGRTVMLRISGGVSAVPNIGVFIRQINYTLGYNGERYEFSWGSGVAGIGDFFLDCFENFHNETHLIKAQQIANFLIENATMSQQGVYWDEGGYSSIDYSTGSAGIIDFLLRVAKYTAFNTSYINTAIAAGRQIISEGYQILVTDRDGIPSYGYIMSNIKGTGYYEGIAGLGSVLLKLAKVSPALPIDDPNNFFTAAQKIGSSLVAKQIGTSSGPVIDGIRSIKLAAEVVNNTDTRLSLGGGMVGALWFLAELQQSVQDSRYGEIIDMVLEDIDLTKISPIAGQNYWINNEFGYSNYSLFYGMAGIGFGLIKIGIRAYDSLKKVNDLLQFQIDSKTTNGDQVNYAGNTNNGLSSGTAGIGLSMIEQYRMTGNKTYYDNAILCADMLSNTSYWSSYGVNRTGIATGFAGIGLFLLEMFYMSNDPKYLAAANLTATKLLEWQFANGSYVYATDDGTVYTSYLTGSAGVNYFLANMYKATQNKTILNALNRGLHFLETIQKPAGYWEYKEGSGSIYYGYGYGVAGIGDVFLTAYEVTGNNSFYQDAIEAAKYIWDQYLIYGIISMSPGDNIEQSGFDFGYAGVIKFLLHMQKVSDPNGYYKANISALLTDLNSMKYSISGGQIAWYKARQGANLIPAVPNYLEGVSGILDVLIEANSIFITHNLLPDIYGGRQYLLAQNIGNFDSGYYTGFNGICLVLSRIPNQDNPTAISPFPLVSANININYNKTLTVSIYTDDLGGNIGSVSIKYNTSLAPSTVYTITMTKGSDGRYAGDIPKFKYNTIVTYYLIIRDMSGIVTVVLDNNAYFSYTVKDDIKTAYSNLIVRGYVMFQGQIIEQGSALTYGPNGGGRIFVDLTEPSDASGISSVSISFSAPSMLTKPEVRSMVKQENTNRYYTILNALNFKAGELFEYTITVIDIAGNVLTLVRNCTISDLNAPVLEKQNTVFNTKREYTSGEEVPIIANVTDDEVNGGSGVKYVAILYTTDATADFENWTELAMTYNSADKLWTGSIPKQRAGLTVTYFLYAVDNAGNKIVFDGNGTQQIYGEKPLFAKSYDVGINWILVLIIVGIVVGAMVAGAAIWYMRGSYLDRMERQASATAIWISIKERFLAVYYRIAESLNRFGDKIEQSIWRSTLGERISDWMEDNVNSPFVKFLKGIFGIVRGYFKALIVGIIALPLGLWKLITGIKAKHAMLIAFFGLLLIVASVIKFFGEELYPLRAIFFIDFGFVLFIGAFSLVILHLIYEIAYK